MRSLIRDISRRPEVRYLVFGGLNTAFSFGLFTVALLVLHAWSVPADYAIAITFSWIVSNLTSFVLQRRYVFKGTGNPLREFVKFTSVTFGSFLANLALSWFSATVLGFAGAVEKLISQFVVTVILVLATYVLHRTFSFRTSGAEPTGMVAVEELPDDKNPLPLDENDTPSAADMSAPADRLAAAEPLGPRDIAATSDAPSDAGYRDPHAGPRA